MNIRPPAVAGTFYPGDASALARQIDGFLARAGDELGEVDAAGAAPPIALVCPHAGTIYSGKTAGIAYAQLLPYRAAIRRVILLGPTHRFGIRGLAVPAVEAFATPLGTIPLDAAGRRRLLELPQVVISDEAHALEHSLEVQLPFLQRALDRFSLLPLAVGDASPAQVAEVLDACWQDETDGSDSLLVISTDLSHFHPYRAAQEIDRDSIDTILALGGPLDHQQACGATPLNGLLLLARQRGLAPHLLDLCNSGDTAGDKGRVVGYASLRFDRKKPAASASPRQAASAREPRP